MTFSNLILCHAIGFASGCILDQIFGDPRWFPHPVIYIGKLIAFFDRKMNKAEISGGKKRKLGILSAFLTLLITLSVTSVLLVGAYMIHPVLGIVLEAVLTSTCLAAKSLKKESMKVYEALISMPPGERISKAQKAVSMIVGRDTDRLSEKGIIKATVETVAESTSDGIIAPFIYLLIGGPLLGMMYKAVNTMDSMIGYKSDKYIDYGRAAARTDDFLNFIPARITAFLMITGVYILNKLHARGEGGELCTAKHSFEIMKRDSLKSTSPNSGWPESVMAGALGIELLGDAYYFGRKVHKEGIGDNLRKPEKEDIVRANRITSVTTYISFFFALLLLSILLTIIML